MGSLESGIPLKRDHHLLRSSSIRSGSINSGNSDGFWGQRNRSRFARLVLFKKINYLQLICTVAVFFFFVFAFQIFFLPGSVMEYGNKSQRAHDFFVGQVNIEDISFLKELDFGEDIKFEPLKVAEKFHKDAIVVNGSVGSRQVLRLGYREPKIAMVFADLWVDQHQIQMATVATALIEIGYEIEVFSLEDGPVSDVWKKVGASLSIITPDENMKFNVDWLNYDGLLVNSLKAVDFLSSLMQEPFKDIPLIWTIHEKTLADRLRRYVLSGQHELIDSWKRVFTRASVVVFPNYVLPIAHSVCDPGNYLVIPGSPKEAWKADKRNVSLNEIINAEIEHKPKDFFIAIVGTQLSYKGLWLDNAFVLKAIHQLLTDFSESSSHLRITVLAGDSTSNYSNIVQTIAVKLGYPNETVKHAAADGENIDNLINSSDLVIYGSFLEEHSFPDILLKAMSLGKPIIAPKIPAIQKHVSDCVNGFLFPKEDMKVLTQIVFQVVSNGKLSLLARNAASMGKHVAKNLLASECVEGYSSLLENILTFPSEVSVPKTAKDIPMKLKSEWRWDYFEAITDEHYPDKDVSKFLDKAEKHFNPSYKDSSVNLDASNDTFVYSIWEEQKLIDMISMRKRKEDEELKERTDQPRGTWDEVYRNARRADRSLHERDEGELERTGQPLCIYEPYFGVGTWPFLHRTSLYRGVGLSTKGRRPGFDDIDGPSRLPLLNNAYYRDALGEYGAFFAIANRIDRIHRNSWIGFQSWRATARMKSLSKTAERSMLDAIESRRHGDALYFWARSDMDSSNLLKQDFWSLCDSVNAGNCRFAFSETLKKMYGLKHDLDSLPPMPLDAGTWSEMHSWALPTKSFLEFVMFSRMFVDALDSQLYDVHQKTGRCYLSLYKDKHCYSRLLELLVNVWAYHSSRRMVYVNPETGVMQELNKLQSRRGRMWIKWFQISTLKTMDEDLAEEFDTEHPKRWLWPSTGEVYWQGTYEKERSMRNKEKEKKRQQSKDKIQRMRKRTHQKALGKYVKPVDTDSNATISKSEISR